MGGGVGSFRSFDTARVKCWVLALLFPLHDNYTVVYFHGHINCADVHMAESFSTDPKFTKDHDNLLHKEKSSLFVHLCAYFTLNL